MTLPPISKTSASTLLLVTVLMLSACSSNMTRREKNMAIGAGIGAAAGAVVTGGSATGTAIGAAAGAAVGYGVTENGKKKKK